MKTVYTKLRPLDLLKPLVLVILFLISGYNAQSQSSNSPVCQNLDDILLTCAGGVITQCDNYTYSGFPKYSWICTATGFTSTQRNPTIAVGDAYYHAGTYFLTVWWGPGASQFENGFTTVVFVDSLTGGIASANQTICPGGTLTNLTATPFGNASGSVTYTWQKSVSPFTTWTNTTITGVTYPPAFPIPPYTFPDAPITVTTKYRVKGENGSCSGYAPQYSTIVTITVQAPPLAGTIAASQSICYNTVPANLTGSAEGTSYTWEQSVSPFTSWSTALPAQTGAGFDFNGTALTQTTKYRRWSISGCISGTPSDTVTITVQGIMTAGSIAENQTICNGSTPAPLTGTPGTGSGTISYRWEVNSNGGGWNIIPGQTGTGYSPGPLTVNTQYRRTTLSTTGSDVCTSALTNVVTIIVQLPVTAGSIAASQTICNGSTPDPLTSTSPGGGSLPVYSWEVNSDGGGWNLIPGVTGAGYTPGALIVNTQYRRTTTSTIGSNVCTSAPTNVVTITVQIPVTAGTIAASQTICNGSTPDPLTSITDGTGSGTITYFWAYSHHDYMGYLGISGATSAGYAPGPLTQTTYFKRTTISTEGTNICYSESTNEISIIVQDPVTAGAIGDNQTICNGTTPNPLTSITPGGGSVPVYSWEVNSNGGGWNIIPGAAGDGYAPGALTVTTQYRRTTTSTIGSNACSSTTAPVTIIVQDVVTAGTIAANQTICSGHATNTITGSGANGSGALSYIWEVNTGIGWSVITGQTGNNYSPGVLYVNTSYRRYTLSVLGIDSCYSDFTNVVTITVTDAPVAGITGPDTLCQNSCATYTATGGMAGDTYQWSISGTYTSMTSFENTVTICWGACTEGVVQVTISRGNCSNTSDPYHVTLLAPPSPLIVGPITVIHGTVSTYTALPGTPGHLFNWTVYDGTIVGGQGTSSIQVLWNSPCLGCTGWVCVYEADPAFEECAHGSACMNVYILPDDANVFGYVSYQNDYLTGMNDVYLTLRNTADYSIVGQCTSAPNMLTNGQSGYFAFHNIPYGSYLLTAEYGVAMEASSGGGGNIPWGGNNATDALIVQLLTPGPLSTPVKTVAADVNGSLTINATDALNIKLRVVGIVNSYNAGDWAFAPATFTLDASNPVKDFGTSFDVLCMGDVNGSYIPTGMKSAPSLTATEDGIQTVAVGESFTYDLRSSSITDLGAMTLFMNYDQNLFEIVNVKTSLEGLQYKVENGKLALAWSDVTPISVSNDSPVISLTVKAKEQISVPTQIFTIGAGSEFANSNAEPLNFNLKLSNVLTGAKSFSLANYPNPFANTTNIVYTLPEAGQVHLVISDLYGKTLGVLVDAMQEAGNHSVVVNPANFNLSQGVYLYKIEVSGATDTYTKVNKLIFNK